MEQTFESSLDELEQIVAKLETGDMPLEESLDLFERGVRLSRECKDRLLKAERRIEMLTREANGDISLAEIDLDQ